MFDKKNDRGAHLFQKLTLCMLLSCVFFGSYCNSEVNNESNESNVFKLPDTGSSNNMVTVGGWNSAPYYDVTTQIETKIHWGYSTNGGDSNNNNVGVSVDSNEVLIGGGAFVYGNDGVLTGSYPLIDKTIVIDGVTIPYATTWCAKSASLPGETRTHTIYVQAIGLKLKRNYPMNTYFTREELLKYVRYTYGTSSIASHPTFTTPRIYGFSIISGGAQVLPQANGEYTSYLTESCPVMGVTTKADYGSYQDLSGWRASSKDHVYAGSSRVVAYAISIINNNGIDYPSWGVPAIPQFGNVNIRWLRDDPAQDAQYFNNATIPPRKIITYPGVIGSLSLYHPPYTAYTNHETPNSCPYLLGDCPYNVTWSITGIGASASYNSNGRLLKTMIINDGNQYGTVQDRDCLYADGGTLNGYMVLMIKDAGNDEWTNGN
jgi:hypothetical protein